MKKIVLSLFAFAAIVNTALASNEVKDSRDKKIEEKSEIAPCRGSAMISDGRGNLVSVDMETVDTANALDCSKIFGVFLGLLQDKGIKIVTYTNIYGYN